MAKDTANNSILFRDSIFMVFADVDIGNPPASLGYTSATGILTLTDADRFLGVLHLPPIPEIGNDPTQVSQFSVLDTAIFVFIDTLTHKRQSERRLIRNGVNSIDVVWSPTEAVNDIASIQRATQAQRVSSTIIGVAGPTQLLATTVIHFDVPQAANIELDILQGNRSVISTPFNRGASSSSYSVIWNTQLQGSPATTAVAPPVKPGNAQLDWKLYQNYPNPFD